MRFHTLHRKKLATPHAVYGCVLQCAVRRHVLFTKCQLVMSLHLPKTKVTPHQKDLSPLTGVEFLMTCCPKYVSPPLRLHDACSDGFHDAGSVSWTPKPFATVPQVAEGPNIDPMAYVMQSKQRGEFVESHVVGISLGCFRRFGKLAGRGACSYNANIMIRLAHQEINQIRIHPHSKGKLGNLESFDQSSAWFRCEGSVKSSIHFKAFGKVSFHTGDVELFGAHNVGASFRVPGIVTIGPDFRIIGSLSGDASLKL